MIGSIAAAYYAVSQPSVGGLAGLGVQSAGARTSSRCCPISPIRTAVVAVLIVPLAVQWWSTWYPGSEPGGGGYIAQRMLAARNEKQAMAATLWFNIAHYAVRPWPWILVALASLIVYPELSDIQARFPHVDPSIIRHDLAYPAMLVFVPHGLLGLVVASLAAAYMSTISTHLNWGASYVVDDVYRRFIRPDASESHYVNVGRGVTVGLMILACARRALARPCHAGVSDPAADRRGHRSHLPVALVLVAHQCLGRDRRHGDLVPACGSICISATRGSALRRFDPALWRS